ncbi:MULTISPECIES: TIGR01459 family HAD-type hydrolase [Novacetimonas]|uniref:Haloacid dehalogenase n=2 Tax=Novacetimonas hansenii TaxID=436 RepID=A0AAW5EQL5_NOVHA|nr:TIGR01459 family HAD-type hydrolase [Novacetimonas hansenii]EFG83376.1 HAD-superfamily subfamily IIA hydrolase like protein [Novacetimonas hansenii ATCC 23769]MCJ8354092.1 TIGR01459 family HAD-type hydrolase [Novacetimonas hansenii]PYD71579.1 TIGR01459 family HAD-type hydrolase [Novacetimonas hansenii]RFP05790.1 HAD family hydrolase [Novacetimonas hansenii]WEQ58848.1 TIGR01459 family HAD-type hydrolase [Novacetimonas hansenii]
MKEASGIAPVSGQYDGYIVDLWGVIHNGVAPYPGAPECLRQLRQAGKRVILLSNAPRRADTVQVGLRTMGIGDDLYEGLMTSGECTRRMLRARTDPWFAQLGRRMLHLGPQKDIDLFAGLDLEVVEDAAQADFVLNTGPDADRGEEDITPYLPVLEQCAQHGLKMICANPDQQVIRGSRRLLCAGALASRYEESHGADVRWIGKPHPEVYDLVAGMMDLPLSRILAVGDSLATDMRGAKGAGVDGCWVLGGIHQEMLGGSWAEGKDADYALALEEARGAGLDPAVCVPSFRW